MEKGKVVVSFVERATSKESTRIAYPCGQILAITADGKRLIRLNSAPEQAAAKRSLAKKSHPLIGVLTERNGQNFNPKINSSSSCSSSSSNNRPCHEVNKEDDTIVEERRAVRLVEPKPLNNLTLRFLMGHDENNNSNEDEDDGQGCDLMKQKIPRPANAFMLFANEWRKKLAGENPRDSNKDISVRLGSLWKTMSKDVKEKYFALAREVDAEHKKKYPDYVYNPKEARLRKAMRDQSRATTAGSTTTPAIGLLQRNQLGSPTMQAGNNHSLTNGFAGSNRMIGPWFSPIGQQQQPTPPMAHQHHQHNHHHHQQQQQTTLNPKPVLSPRALATYQRTLDKKEAMRKQLQDCSSYPTYQAYPADYPTVQEAPQSHNQSGPMDYCAAYSDSNTSPKWYSYEHGTSAYHSRTSLMSKMNNLHRSMQATSHVTSPWGQFNLPLQTSQSAMPRSSSNRHSMVFLQQEQQNQQSLQQQQRAEYNNGGDDSRSSSRESKTRDDLPRQLYSPCPQEERQNKSPVVERLTDHSRDSPKSNCCTPEDAPRWSTPRPSSVSSSSCTTDTLILEREDLALTQQQQSQQHRSKQPLPGFKQAFGSTEIGKFSRSELFASLIEAANTLLAKENLPKSDSSYPKPSQTQSVKINENESMVKVRVRNEGCFLIKASDLINFRQSIMNLKSQGIKRKASAEQESPSSPDPPPAHCNNLQPLKSRHSRLTTSNFSPTDKDEVDYSIGLDLRVASRKDIANAVEMDQEMPDSSVDTV